MIRIGDREISRPEETQAPEPRPPAQELSILQAIRMEFIRTASEGQLAVHFREQLRHSKHLQPLVGLTSSRAAALIRKQLLSRMPYAPQEELAGMAEKVYNALSYATYKELERQICLKASAALKDTSSRLRLIAGNDTLLDAFYRRIQADPRLDSWGRLICDDRAVYSRADLRHGLRAQAEAMERQAEGLHAEYLRGKEQTLEENPTFSRDLLRRLPEGSFVRDAFMSHEIREKKRREFWNDTREWIKAGSSIGMMFASGGLAKAVRVGKLAVDYQRSGDEFLQSGLRAAASLASGGTTLAEFDQAQQKRNLDHLIDTLSLATATVGLVSGNSLMSPADKVLCNLARGVARTASEAQPLPKVSENAETLRRLILDLTGRRQ